MTMFNAYINPSTNTMNNIQVGATNLLIELEIREAYSPIDISSATIKRIIIKRPDDSLLTKDASFVTDGTDGKISYNTIVTDLNQAGNYQVQAYIEMTGFSGYSTINTFDVTANL